MRIAVDEYSLGARIKYFRKTRRGLTQKHVATRCRITQGYLAQIELGQCDPSLDTLRKISKVLEVNIATLFSGEEILVFDLKKLKKSYKKKSDLTDYLNESLIKIVHYAKSIGIE